ncbi:hypothetical protein APHAL10511_004916 [Amanita phalloides]|nr:hypothetical protein APHAL10511_004916 [Amanita phalloides]
MSSLLAFLVLLHATIAQAYIPAQATNFSHASPDGSFNVTSASSIYLQWYLNGTTTDNVSYQLAGSQSDGISRGALILFSEAFVNESTPPTNAPWIAMIACDANATNASMELDIFTLARDKGAKAALLYSSYSLACVINPEYADPEVFDHVFDIFSTQDLSTARLIELQLRQTDPAHIFRFYNSQRLNDSETEINATLTAGYPAAPGYLYAVLEAYNATGSPTITGGNITATHTQASSNGTSSPSTALAMIVLYAITGCVSALFCVVIVSGAIRAIRHPERYGPRARFGADGSPQSRARGLTRAILDTFPVVKFGSVPREAPDEPAGKDIEAQTSENNETELKVRERCEEDGHEKLPTEQELREDMERHSLGGLGITNPSEPVPDIQIEHIQEQLRPPEQDSGPISSSSTRNNNEVMPESIGTETCPICILDFEEGDDVRILPCEGQHRFHQSCVDPWLLKLSSSCPICRHDFHALETMLSNDLEDEDARDHRHSRRLSQSMLTNRFSRYLRFARRRRSRLQREMERDEALAEPQTSMPPDVITQES